jgi:hypothetical protein
MGRMQDSLTETQAQRDLLKLLENKTLARAIGTTLAEIAVELADYKLEVKHWKNSFEAVRLEIRTLAGIILAQRGPNARIVVTEKELRAIPHNLELYVGAPEPGVRIYELRPKENKPSVVTDVRSILARPN